MLRAVFFTLILLFGCVMGTHESGAALRAVANNASVSLDALEVYRTTMATTNTAAQNVAAFAADVAAVQTGGAAAGKTIYIPNGTYPIGTSTQEVIQYNSATKIVFAPQAQLQVASGYTNVPIQFNTSALWADYTVSAISTVTSGCDLSTESEATKVTLTTTPPTDLAGKDAAIFSNDLLPYNDGDSANFAQEIVHIQKVEGNDVCFTTKVNRTYTPANYVRFRVFNDDAASIDLEEFRTMVSGDPYDPTVTSRPAAVFQVVGGRNHKIVNPHFDELWAGGFRYNYTRNLTRYGGDSGRVPNGMLATIGTTATSVTVGTGSTGTLTTQAGLGLTSSNDIKIYSAANPANYVYGDVTSYSGTSLVGSIDTIGGSGSFTDGVIQKYVAVLGYIEAKDGTNFNVRGIGGDFHEGRHFTNTFFEEELLTITGGTSGATTVFSYSTNSSGSRPAVDDLVYIAAVGGITACNNAWYTITARTGTDTGTFTIACNSTGTYTSGGTAQLFQPDQAWRYGEDDSYEISDIHGVANTGNLCDEHNGSINGACRNGSINSPIENLQNSINPRSAQKRGIGQMISEWYQYRGVQFANFFSASQNHGLDNTPYDHDIHLRNQQDKTAAQAYWLTTGDSTVTDYRHWWTNNAMVDGGAYKLIDHVANSGDMSVTGLMFMGDWGISSTASAYMFNQAGTDTLSVRRCSLDLTKAVSASGTNDEVRISQTNAGTTDLSWCYFKNISGESNYPFVLSASSGTVTANVNCNYCTFELDPNATDGTIKLFRVSSTGTGTALTANIYLSNSIIKNAAKLNSTNGLMSVSATAGETSVGNLYIENLQTDAAILTSSLEASGGTETANVVGGVKVKGKFNTCFALYPTTVAGDIVAGTKLATALVPAAFKLTEVFASVNTAGTTSVETIDVNEDGTTVISTKLTIDATETTSLTAATPYVISDSDIAAGAILSADVDSADSGNTGVGLEVKVCGYYK